MDGKRFDIVKKLGNDLQVSKKQLEEAYLTWNGLIREYYLLHGASVRATWVP
jgi:hypothetical protein